MSTDVKALLDGIKNKTFFEIVVELNQTLRFKGRVPFDLKIEGNVATFKVLASSEKEAETMVYSYLMELDE